MKTLALAKELKLPIDLATHVTLVAGKRGSGKTNTAKRLVEQAIRAGVPVAVLDPADVWWGLRAGRDGAAAAGLPIHVFGGRHQDLPLESTAGAVLADVVIEQRVSVVLALREFSGAERARFITDFADRLIRKNTNPLLVVAEEAHEVMPQGKTMGVESVSLGAMLRLVTLGRSSGIGLLQVTQRLARLNKTATTQSDVLFAHRTIGPQDRDALEEWIKYHHAGTHRAAFMERLPELKTGEAWLWAPDFPEDDPIGLRQVRIAECETFNSHATPKVGEIRQEPKALAPVDLERLRTRMAATIERVKADDPRELRKRIAELERAVVKAGSQQNPTSAPIRQPPTVVEKPVITDKQLAAVERLVERAAKVVQPLTEAAHQIAAAVDDIKASCARVVHPPAASSTAIRLAPGVKAVRPAPERPRQTGRQESGVGSSNLPPGERAVLTAALQYPDGLDRKRLGILTGYKRSSRDAYIARLAQKGLVSTSGGALYPTDAGRAALNGSFEPLPTGAALVDYWRQRLPEGERKTLDVLLKAGGGDVARERIDEATGYRRSSRDAYLTRLKARGLVDVAGPGAVRASPTLMEG